MLLSQGKTTTGAVHTRGPTPRAIGAAALLLLLMASSLASQRAEAARLVPQTVPAVTAPHGPPVPEVDPARYRPEPPRPKPRDAFQPTPGFTTEHERAVQDLTAPATTRWAVLVGVNEYAGRTRDNIGSRQDAEDLQVHLLQQGWRNDHIVLLTDDFATRAAVEQALDWLARKTDRNSLAVFHFSGHTKQWHGWDADEDGEGLDEGLWPADNDHITDRELTERLAAIDAARMWINVAACEAAGYADPGLRRDGRVLTFSSQEQEKSYELPSEGNSVWGHYVIDQAMMARKGDRNGDGDVTVQEAFLYAGPRSAEHTDRGNTAHGPQHPVIADDAGAFSLAIPPRAR